MHCMLVGPNHDQEPVEWTQMHPLIALADGVGSRSLEGNWAAPPFKELACKHHWSAFGFNVIPQAQ